MLRGYVVLLSYYSNFDGGEKLALTRVKSVVYTGKVEMHESSVVVVRCGTVMENVRRFLPVETIGVLLWVNVEVYILRMHGCSMVVCEYVCKCACLYAICIVKTI